MASNLDKYLNDFDVSNYDIKSTSGYNNFYINNNLFLTLPKKMKETNIHIISDNIKVGVLLLGVTGAGKSTTINFLLRPNCCFNKNEKLLNIDDICLQKEDNKRVTVCTEPIIKNNVLYRKYLFLNNNNEDIYLIDTPGMGDITDPNIFYQNYNLKPTFVDEQYTDFINLVTTCESLKHLQYLKCILFVLNITDLRLDKNDNKEAIINYMKLFPGLFKRGVIIILNYTNMVPCQNNFDDDTIKLKMINIQDYFNNIVCDIELKDYYHKDEKLNLFIIPFDAKPSTPERYLVSLIQRQKIIETIFLFKNFDFKNLKIPKTNKLKKLHLKLKENKEEDKKTNNELLNIFHDQGAIFIQEYNQKDQELKLIEQQIDKYSKNLEDWDNDEVYILHAKKIEENWGFFSTGLVKDLQYVSAYDIKNHEFNHNGYSKILSEEIKDNNRTSHIKIKSYFWRGLYGNYVVSTTNKVKYYKKIAKNQEDLKDCIERKNRIILEMIKFKAQHKSIEIQINKLQLIVDKIEEEIKKYSMNYYPNVDYIKQELHLNYEHILNLQYEKNQDNNLYEDLNIGVVYNNYKNKIFIDFLKDGLNEIKRLYKRELDTRKKIYSIVLDLEYFKDKNKKIEK